MSLAKPAVTVEFTEFLDAERWYAFEAHETEKALRAWCDENGIALVDASRGGITGGR